MRFSTELDDWLKSDAPKSLGALGDVFAEKTIALTIMLLLIVSATPLPTGGIMFVFQIGAAIVAVQVMLGRRKIWLPARWRHRELGAAWTTKAIPFIIRRVRWFERHSRPRWSSLYERRFFYRLLGVGLLILSVTSALAPPLSGLDTLPALGGVIIALSMILKDVVWLVIGAVIGTGGILLFIAVGTAMFHMFQDIF